MADRRFLGINKLPTGADAAGVWTVKEAYYASLDSQWPGPVPDPVYYLVVAGGAGGSGAAGGGGGAGGYRSAWNGETSGGGAGAETGFTPISQVAYTVTVGGGGGLNSNGSPSTFATVTSTGGGRGGNNSPTSNNGASGGSGGGGSAGSGPVGGSSGGSGTSGQGYPGGPAASNGGPGRCPSGGGGGAASAGETGTCYSPNRSQGGNERDSTIAGASQSRARGGDGQGVPAGDARSPLGVNSGSGGRSSTVQEAGDSGVVVLRFAGPDPTVSAGLTYVRTTSGADTIYTFTNGSGTVTW